jgi:putative hemolysin
MKKLQYLLFAFILASFMLAGCGRGGNINHLNRFKNEPTAKTADIKNVPSPATTNCERKGGKVKNRKNAEGQYKACVFSDGSECEEWAFFRGQCKPGSAQPDTAVITNFDDCVKAGNPVMESYPRKCNAGGQTFTEVLDKPVTPPPSDGQPATCPTEKNTVCALIQVQCIKAPCPPLFETIDNECLAKDRGSMLLGYTPGVCEKTLDTTCKIDDDCVLPGEYAAMSRCPMEAKCVADACVVVCPWSAK